MLQTWIDSVQRPQVSETPHQPHFLKLRNTSAMHKWNSDVRTERAFCHICVTAFKQKKLNAANADVAFYDWKMLPNLMKFPLVSRKLLQSLYSTSYNKRCINSQKSVNRVCFLKVLSSIRFLARRDLALRGDDDRNNFTHLLRLRGEDDPALLEWLSKKTNKYTFTL